jgi:hypothetical protein
MAIVYTLENGDKWAALKAPKQYVAERAARYPGGNLRLQVEWDGNWRRISHKHDCPHYVGYGALPDYYDINRLYPDCVNYDSQQAENGPAYGCGPFGPTVRLIAWEGCVLEERESNFLDDSDFYAYVWDAERGCTMSHEYATTRFGGGGWCSVDATPEVRAAAAEYTKGQLLSILQQENELQATYRQVGRIVRLNMDGTLPVRDKAARAELESYRGALGVIRWQGERKYGQSRWAPTYVRIGVEILADELLLQGAGYVFMDPDNVEVAFPDMYLVPAEQLERAADNGKGRPSAPAGLIMNRVASRTGMVYV